MYIVCFPGILLMDLTKWNTVSDDLWYGRQSALAPANIMLELSQISYSLSAMLAIYYINPG